MPCGKVCDITLLQDLKSANKELSQMEKMVSGLYSYADNIVIVLLENKVEHIHLIVQMCIMH